MTERKLVEITADVAAVIEQTQGRMQCMVDPRDAIRYLPDELDPALLAEFGRALARREIQNIYCAHWQQLVTAGQARKHKDGRVTRRYD